jgi:hypothetical protein
MQWRARGTSGPFLTGYLWRSRGHLERRAVLTISRINCPNLAAIIGSNVHFHAPSPPPSVNRHLEFFIFFGDVASRGLPAEFLLVRYSACGRRDGKRENLIWIKVGFANLGRRNENLPTVAFR